MPYLIWALGAVNFQIMVPCGMMRRAERGTQSVE